MDKIINKITAFTLAEESHQFARIARKFGGNLNTLSNSMAFTLAEVLITLAIIGVVSALVIPSVLKNYNDKKYNTARLKALKTFGEAGKMASINGEINGQENARAFVENVLSKYLKITKVCDTAEKCGFPTKFKTLAGDIKTADNFKSWKDLNITISTINHWTDVDSSAFSIYITTADGFSAKMFYNPKCARNSHEIILVDLFGDNCPYKECWSYAVDEACVNTVYDMNGEKGPNHVGEDISFVTTFWSGLNSISVAPGLPPYSEDLNSSNYRYADAISKCANLRTSKVKYSLPSIDELQSMALNRNIISMTHSFFWSSSLVTDRPGSIWYGNGGGFRAHRGDYSLLAWCVRR